MINKTKQNKTIFFNLLIYFPFLALFSQLLSSQIVIKDSIVIIPKTQIIPSIIIPDPLPDPDPLPRTKYFMTSDYAGFPAADFVFLPGTLENVRLKLTYNLTLLNLDAYYPQGFSFTMVPIYLGPYIFSVDVPPSNQVTQSGTVDVFDLYGSGLPSEGLFNFSMHHGGPTGLTINDAGDSAVFSYHFDVPLHYILDGTATLYVDTTKSAKISITVSDETLLPLSDSDNKGPKKARVIDFSNVKRTKVTVIVKDGSDTPMPNYPFTINALIRGYSGGHDHNTTRPVGRFILKKDTVSVMKCTTDVKGEIKLDYLCSGFGGVDSIFVQGETNKDTASATIVVKVPGLTELTSGSHYDLIGANAGGSHHNKNHYGKANLINTLKTIADTAYSKKSYRLRFNDMSLIYGGPFDINNNWDTPHQNHREGVSVDVSSTAVTDNGSSRSVTEDRLSNWLGTSSRGFRYYSIQNEVLTARHYHVTVP
ncbi:MAG: penicillin-insensitive murein endopeptidase [Bacteroidota bacterium]